MKNDTDWVKQQIQAAKVKKPVGNAILSMVNAFQESFSGLSPEETERFVEVFSKIVQGHAIAKENKDEVWIPLSPGNITVGDVVRVKSDAFSGDLGQIHNGRVGSVVAVRYGDVIFKSRDEKKPVLDGAHYSPHDLEKLVEIRT
jgi:hypothetical protein